MTEIILSEENRADVHRACESALSDLEWIESTVPGSHFQSSILLLRNAISLLDGRAMAEKLRLIQERQEDEPESAFQTSEADLDRWDQIAVIEGGE